MKRFLQVVVVVSVLFGGTTLAKAGVIIAGTDVAPSSVSEFTLYLGLGGPAIETISLSGGSFSIIRQQQQGTGDGSAASFIDTEMRGLTLTGMSSMGAVTLKAGADLIGTQTLGRINNVVSNPIGLPTLVGPDQFVSGNSFFDVFFEVTIGSNTYHNNSPERMVAFITQLPPYGTTHIAPQTIQLFDANNQPTGIYAGGTHTVTPEPSSLVVFGLGLLGAGFASRKRLQRVKAGC